jgi:hypothetical protein
MDQESKGLRPKGRRQKSTSQKRKKFEKKKKLGSIRPVSKAERAEVGMEES